MEKNYTVDYWRDLFSQRSDLPWERVAAWMTIESEGFPQALGTSYEVGIVQLDLQDGPKFGGTLANLHGDFSSGSVRTRDLTDDEEALQVDVATRYIDSLVATAQSQTASLGWSDDDVWCLVKLHHALPGLAGQGFNYAVSHGQAQDWDTMRSYLESLPCGTFTWGCAYSPWGRLFDNAEKVGKLGLSGLTSSGGLSTLLVLAFVAFALWRFA